MIRVSRVGSARERMQGARRGPWLIPRASRATPQTPLPEPTLRERTDLPSFIVVASSLEHTQLRRLRLDRSQIRHARGHGDHSDRLPVFSLNQRSKITQAAAASTSDLATRRRRKPDSRADFSRAAASSEE